MTRLSPPSMWSKERFSIIRTTMCFRLSIPAGIYTPNSSAEMDESNVSSGQGRKSYHCPQSTVHERKTQALRAGCFCDSRSRAQNFHSALEKAFELTRFDLRARITFLGKVPRRCKTAFE